MRDAEDIGPVRRKSDGHVFEVAMGTQEHAYLYRKGEPIPPVTWEELRDGFTMLDGAPCGVEET